MKFTVITKNESYKIMVESTYDVRHWIINHLDLSDTSIEVKEGWTE